MEIFEPLPFNLRSKFRQDIAPTIRQRLEHLWKSAHTMRSTSLSHTLMRQFRAIVDEHGVDLPAYVSNKICQWCAALMIPSVTCRIRVKRLERKSRAQKKLLALNASGGVGKERSETSNSARLKNCIVSITKFILIA
jgi:RNase P subunit RPR2